LWRFGAAGRRTLVKWRETTLDLREAELFRGREAERAAARALFAQPLPIDARQVLHVTGVGGIGKTALPFSTA
jgi:hypothetical protein